MVPGEALSVLAGLLVRIALGDDELSHRSGEVRLVDRAVVVSNRVDDLALDVMDDLPGRAHVFV